mmetsp:Transcript_3795/g.7962  ORF Transcript_3795/g.7962 Transcript_3795/m.7962 type:complete len:502 (+) Transcript_3795:150-1655(+)
MMGENLLKHAFLDEQIDFFDGEIRQKEINIQKTSIVDAHWIQNKNARNSDRGNLRRVLSNKCADTSEFLCTRIVKLHYALIMCDDIVMHKSVREHCPKLCGACTDAPSDLASSSPTIYPSTRFSPTEIVTSTPSVTPSDQPTFIFEADTNSPSQDPSTLITDSIYSGIDETHKRTEKKDPQQYFQQILYGENKLFPVQNSLGIILIGMGVLTLLVGLFTIQRNKRYRSRITEEVLGEEKTKQIKEMMKNKKESLRKKDQTVSFQLNDCHNDTVVDENMLEENRKNNSFTLENNKETVNSQHNSKIPNTRLSTTISKFLQESNIKSIQNNMTKIKPIAESWGDNIKNMKSLISSPCKCNLDDSADLSSLPYSYQQKSMKVFTNEVTDDKIPGDDWNSIRSSFQKVAHLPEQEYHPTELEDNGKMNIINEDTPLSAVGCTNIHDGLFSLVTEFGRDMAISNLSKLESKISSRFQNFSFEQKLDTPGCGPPAQHNPNIGSDAFI